MPSQEVFFSQEFEGKKIEVVKTYDSHFAREAFENMDEHAQTLLWLTLSAAAMADSAWQTAAQSGKVSLSVNKDKKFVFTTKGELERHLIELMESQEGLCALTNLVMLHYGFDGDADLRCSLDRIDSDAHYERGNLQVVCWFANRWKGASDDEKFKQLIEKIRG
jgi:hypothetical protein